MLRSFTASTPALALALASALTLAGCATGKPPVADSAATGAAGGPARIKQIGVLSELGDDFHVVRMGFTNFQNLHYDATVSDWQIDEVATASALKLLSENDRIKAVAFDKSHLSPAQLASNKSDALWQAAQRQGLDTLIIVRPSEISALKHFTPGVGLYERKMIGEGDRCIYTAYIVKVFDVNSRKELDSNWGGPAPCKVGADEQVPFKTEFTEYSAAEKDVMRKLMAARFDDTLAYTLGTLTYGAPKRRKPAATTLASAAPVPTTAIATAASGNAPATVTVTAKPATDAKDDKDEDKDDDDSNTLTRSMIWKYLPEFKAHKY
jgi:hypothetical protein